jgi:hypothetical protein
MRLLLVFLAITLFGVSCGNSNQDTVVKADSPLDAGREFIDGCLKGQFEQAALYMVDNENNRQALEKLAKSYKSRSGADKKQYKQASIIIEGMDTVADSITIINYRNSFDRIARKLKVVKQHQGWRVDFTYTFSGNM